MGALIFFLIISIIFNISQYTDKKAKDIRQLEEKIKELTVLNTDLQVKQQETQSKYDKIINAKLTPTKTPSLIVKRVDRKQFSNALKACSDNLLYLSFLDKDLTIHDSKTRITLTCR